MWYVITFIVASILTAYGVYKFFTSDMFEKADEDGLNS